jgi:hypothetical protein
MDGIARHRKWSAMLVGTKLGTDATPKVLRWNLLTARFLGNWSGWEMTMRLFYDPRLYKADRPEP